MSEQPQYADVVIVTLAKDELPVTDERVKMHPLIDLYGKRSETVKLDVLVKDGKVIIMPCGTLELKYPENLPQNLDSSLFDSKGREIRIGGFGIVENEHAQLLIIERRDGKRYIPGGLVEKTDPSIDFTASREIKEETKFDLGKKKGIPSHIYEAIVHRNGSVGVRNIMVIFFYDECKSDGIELIPQESECKSVEWIKPYDFWKMYSQNPSYSLPSMKGILQEWGTRKLSFEKRFDQLYLDRHRNLCKDPLAFDLAVVDGLDSFLNYGNDFDDWIESIYMRVQKDFSVVFWEQ